MTEIIRELSLEEIAVVSGGMEEIVVTGTRGGGSNNTGVMQDNHDAGAQKDAVELAKLRNLAKKAPRDENAPVKPINHGTDLPPVVHVTQGTTVQPWIPGGATVSHPAVGVKVKVRF